MFSLVKFENGDFTITSSKRVKIIQGDKCIVKSKGGATYQGIFVRAEDDKTILDALREQLLNIIASNTPDNPIEKNDKPKSKTSKAKTLKKKKRRQSKNQKSTNMKRQGEAIEKQKQLSSVSDNSSLRDGCASNLLVSGKDDIYTQDKLIITPEGAQNSKISITCNGSSVLSSTLDHQPTSTPNETSLGTSTFTRDLKKNQLNISEICREVSVRLTDISSAPSGFTTILQEMGDKWPDETSVEAEKGSEELDEEDFDNTGTSTHSNKNVIQEDTALDADDESEEDPDYAPEETGESETENADSIRSVSRSEVSFLSNSSPALDIQTLDVPVSKIREQRTVKKHFCFFCHTLQTKIARHFSLKHIQEDDVKKWINMPKGSTARRGLIDDLRKKGDYLHNVKAEYNSGILITSRQRQAKYLNSGEDYICCKKCKAFYSKKTLRIHYSTCDPGHKKGTRNIVVGGRRLSGFIHAKADPVLRRAIFPVLRDDDVTRSIRYDELVILFGNKLCNKYTLDHQHDMIRAQLRLLGRFKLAIKSIDSEIEDFSSIFKPQRFNAAVEALRIVAQWNPVTMWFKTPAVAQNLTTLIKKMANKLRTECIKVQDEAGKKNVEDFLLLWEEEVPVLINKKALEGQVLQKRQKQVVLPTREDIKLLYDYLKKEAHTCFNLLQKKFDLAAWTLLNECTLILIQIFNRRRAGEIERLKLIDYELKVGLDENINKDLYENLSADTIQFAKQYVRVSLRGKLDRPVSALLNPFLVGCVDTLLKLRKKADVSADNQYVFAVPNTNSIKKKYIRACPLMRRFANECGASIPSALRGTELRKHMATFTAMLDIEDNELDRLANFMGHHKDIHKEIYRVPVPVAEMTGVSKLLIAAMGGDNEGDTSSEDQNSDTSDEEEQNESSRNDSAAATPGNQESLPSTSGNSCQKTSPTLSRKRRWIESSPESSNVNNSSGMRKRSTSPFGKTKRRKWTTAEKDAVAAHFGKLKDLAKLPSLTECLNAIKKYQVLSKRQPQQLKSYIDNQRKRESRRAMYAKKKKIE